MDFGDGAELTFAPVFDNFLSSYPDEIVKFNDKAIQKDIYLGIFPFGRTLIPESYELANQFSLMFSLGVLCTLRLVPAMQDKPQFMQDIALHYGAAFLDGMNTSIYEQEKKEEAQERLEEPTSS